jgi:tight adherence protein C
MTPHVALLVGFFIFVLASVCGVGYWFVRRQTVDSTDDSASRLDLVTPDERATLSATALGLLHALGQWIPTPEGTRTVMRRRLLYAGYRRASDITSFFGMKCASAIFLALVLGLLAARNDGSLFFTGAICGLGLGFLGPDRFLDARIADRNNRLRRSLPSALDLMVMSLEAGQALDQAILSSSRGIRVFSPELSAELSQVYVQTRTGVSRQEALRLMGENTLEPEIRKFTQLLIDSDRFGSSLAPTLRQHARFLRIRFRQRAQETARKLSVKLVFPVFFLIFPSVLVVTLGPAMLTLMRNFKGFGL